MDPHSNKIESCIPLFSETADKELSNEQLLRVTRRKGRVLRADLFAGPEAPSP